MLKDLFEEILADLGQRRSDDTETRRMLQHLQSKDKATLIDDLTEVHLLLQRREDEMRKICVTGLEQLTTEAPMLALRSDVRHLKDDLATTREEIDRHLSCSDTIVQRLLGEVFRREREVTERENRVWGWRMAMAGDQGALQRELADLEAREESLRIRTREVSHREEVVMKLEKALAAKEVDLEAREESHRLRMLPYVVPDEVNALRRNIAERSGRLRNEVEKLATSYSS